MRLCNDTLAGRCLFTLRLAGSYLLFLSVLFMLLYLILPLLSAVPLLLAAFVLYFFRNPQRAVPARDDTILAPADGVVMGVEKVQEAQFIRGETVKVSIFLSLFDVHFNRSPLPGEVVYRHYRPGRFIPAFKSHASEINEKNFVGITGRDGGRYLVCQLTGFFARRIRCWANQGDRIARGEIIGIIKFGSGTELFVPPNLRILVKAGDRVRGGETVIAVIPIGDGIGDGYGKGDCHA